MGKFSLDCHKLKIFKHSLAQISEKQSSYGLRLGKALTPEQRFRVGDHPSQFITVRLSFLFPFLQTLIKAKTFSNGQRGNPHDIVPPDWNTVNYP